MKSEILLCSSYHQQQTLIQKPLLGPLNMPACKTKGSFLFLRLAMLPVVSTHYFIWMEKCSRKIKLPFWQIRVLFKKIFPESSPGWVKYLPTGNKNLRDALGISYWKPRCLKIKTTGWKALKKGNLCSSYWAGIFLEMWHF